MKTEVKTLIAALTTERNSIDRAITALKAMSDSGEPKPVATAKARTRAKEAKPRTFLSDEVKRQIVLRMQGSPNLWATARLCAREFGAVATTVNTSWRVWQQQLGMNGNVAAHIAEPQPEMAGAVQ